MSRSPQGGRFSRNEVSISREEWEVIGAILKKLEKRKVGTTSQISSHSAEMDSPAQHSNTKVQSELS